MTKTLEHLLAEATIRDIQMRYCRAADRMDFDLFRTCFHPDAVISFSFLTGGVDDFIAMSREMLARFTLTTHFTGNALIAVNGDTARAEYYTVATHRLAADDKGPERDYVASIRYIDKVERRDGEWRIARRQCIQDWARTDPVPEYSDGPKKGSGRRDRSDVCYRTD